jgi:hypothetical protein
MHIYYRHIECNAGQKPARRLTVLGDLAAALHCRLATRSLARSSRACQCCAAAATSLPTPLASCSSSRAAHAPGVGFPVAGIAAGTHLYATAVMLSRAIAVSIQAPTRTTSVRGHVWCCHARTVVEWREARSTGAWARRCARLAAVRAALSGVPAAGPASSSAACSRRSLRKQPQRLCTPSGEPSVGQCAGSQGFCQARVCRSKGINTVLAQHVCTALKTPHLVSPMEIASCSDSTSLAVTTTPAPCKLGPPLALCSCRRLRI